MRMMSLDGMSSEAAGSNVVSAAVKAMCSVFADGTGVSSASPISAPIVPLVIPLMPGIHALMRREKIGPKACITRARAWAPAFAGVAKESGMTLLAQHLLYILGQ